MEERESPRDEKEIITQMIADYEENEANFNRLWTEALVQDVQEQ